MKFYIDIRTEIIPSEISRSIVFIHGIGFKHTSFIVESTGNIIFGNITTTADT